MADDMEQILRNSLDAVDRGRRWATFGVAALFVATMFLMLAAFFHAGGDGGPGTAKALFFVGMAQMLFVGCATAAVIFHITRMTKAILRAIEICKK